jgi:alkaline phosphatase D
MTNKIQNSKFKNTKHFPFVLLTVVLLTGILFGCDGKQKQKDQKPYLVVLSMDGFRWDYTDKVNTPNFDKIARQGVKAKSIVPSFPTKTFPNHYTLATGLYPDHHGIVLNGFYDPVEKRHYSVGNRSSVQDGSFYGGEPIWVTAEKQGVKSASLFWVGSEAEIKGVRPSIWKTYQHKMPYENRIDTVISWLQLPQPERPHLIMWYFDEPDSEGHQSGPDGLKTFDTIERLDSLLGVFLVKLEVLPIADQINFIVTSDHGMCATSDDRVVMLNEYIPEEWVEEIQGNSPVWTIKAKEGYKNNIEEKLAEIEHVTAWPSAKVPEHLHYGKNPRTLDFVVVADSAWSVFYDRKGSYFGGAHGYDDGNTDMHAIFYGVGPIFKTNYFQPSFTNVSLYPLMCEILNLEAAPNDGSLEDVKGMLNTK